jgi:hypothetical protein
VLAIEEGPCIDVTIDLVDALDAVGDQLDGGEAAVANAGGRFCQAEGA